jgi:N utilization substance protein B
VARTGRHGARRLLLQALYQLQLAAPEPAELSEQFRTHPDYARVDAKYFQVLLPKICAHRADLDAAIDAAGDISGEQLDPVERAILWVALAELEFQPDLPPKVIINEAIELAKEFGAEGGYRYVNAVLDKHCARERTGPA